MAQDLGKVDFNGTTVMFATNDIVDMISMSYQATCAAVPVASKGDTAHTYEAGKPRRTLTVGVRGATTLSKGDEGATVVAWNDGGDHGSFANAIVTAVRQGGSEDNPIGTEITFKPTPAA